jgi:hypothetical protein
MDVLVQLFQEERAAIEGRPMAGTVPRRAPVAAGPVTRKSARPALYSSP